MRPVKHKKVWNETGGGRRHNLRKTPRENMPVTKIRQVWCVLPGQVSPQEGGGGGASAAASESERGAGEKLNTA